MSAKQKILHHGHGPSNLNLDSLFAPLMFAGLPNHSALSTMIKPSLNNLTTCGICSISAHSILPLIFLFKEKCGWL